MAKEFLVLKENGEYQPMKFIAEKNKMSEELAKEHKLQEGEEIVEARIIGTTIKALPDNLTICHLEVLLMPNGEVLCGGKTLGQFKFFQNYLSQ
jgi:hypothetical protein